jgi:hypothetical protein
VRNAHVLDVDAEIKRRERNRRGQTPRESRDVLGWGGAPWGAIVDGYQKIDTTWHRIDRPEDIDLDALRQSHPTFAGLKLDDAAELWRESLGELESTATRPNPPGGEL